jgi:formylglycine-generating enzyme required for sulfatase activity
VFLFAYRPQSEVKPGGDGRLVPVPTNGSAAVTGLELAGDPVLTVGVVAAGSGAEQLELSAGDLITEINGFPCDEGVFVTSVQDGGAAAKAGVVPGDRVTRVSDDDVVSLFDFDDTSVRLRMRAGPVSRDTGVVRLQCEHGSGDVAVVDVDVRRGSLGAVAGLTLGTAAALLRCAVPVPLALTLCVGGESRSETLPAEQSLGATVTHTAYPLIFSSRNRIGVLPLDPLELDPGSYLIVTRQSGYADLRLTASIEPRVATELDARMLTLESVPEGFIHVPRGSLLMGGDPNAAVMMRDETKAVADFFIAEREVTVGEYLSFLDAPEQRDRRKEFAPNDPDDPGPRDPSGRPSIAIGNEHVLCSDDMPILGVPWTAADGYCAWLTARNPKWRFRLPRITEWMRAARGSDSRPFPWGKDFAWLFCKSGNCRPHLPNSVNPVPEPILRCLGDESPFGVRDLGGSAREWLASDGVLNQSPVMGGTWMSKNPRDFRCTSYESLSLQQCDWSTGFRLCAEKK